MLQCAGLVATNLYRPSRRQGLAFIFGPLFKRGVNGEQKFRACAMSGQACADECDCQWMSVRRSWEYDGQADADDSFEREDQGEKETRQAWKGADPMAPRRCCGCIFLRSKDLNRHWEEKHVQGVGVCADGYRSFPRPRALLAPPLEAGPLRCCSSRPPPLQSCFRWGRKEPSTMVFPKEGEASRPSSLRKRKLPRPSSTMVLPLLPISPFPSPPRPLPGTLDAQNTASGPSLSTFCSRAPCPSDNGQGVNI